MRPITLSLAALALVCASCDNNKLYPVYGSVTHKGEPAVGAAVFFNRQGRDPMNDHLVMGIVKEDGSFELVCGPLGKGAPAGEYDVLIEWKQSKDHGKRHLQHGEDKLQGRYADPKHPLLHATVQAGHNQLAPFELSVPELTPKAPGRSRRSGSR